MKSFLHIVLIIALGFGAQLFLPFWGLVVSAFLVGMFLIAATGPRSFFIGLIGGVLLWGGMAIYQQLPNGGQLAEQVSGLMGVGSKWVLVCSTALLGGILAGLGSMSGHYFRSLVSTSS